MPQPISDVAPDANIAFANVGDRPLARHPDLALLAMEAIESWSNVENFMLNFFLELFGGNRTLAANVYLSLDGWNAKSSAIRAAANSVLDENSNRLLNAILAVFKTNQKSRDKLAHWTWGDSPQVPDGLLLANPKAQITDTDKDQIYVYREQDFKNIIEANNRLCGYAQLFQFILMGHIANANNELFDQLCREPEIQERLSRPV